MALRIAPEITLRKQLERQPDMLPNGHLRVIPQRPELTFESKRS